MKYSKIVILSCMCFLMFDNLIAQVKIGDNELSTGNQRLLEIERAGELFIVTDSLEIGITTSTLNNNPGTDALMMKLYGYGLGVLTPSVQGFNQIYFLGTKSEGEVLEFPLTLEWAELNDSIVKIGLSNGNIIFDTLDLGPLDSFFVTDSELSDTINEVRTLIQLVDDGDGDTITGNEYNTLLTINNANLDLELTDGGGTLTAPLDSFFASDTQLADSVIQLRYELDSTATVIRSELRDTATVLRDLIDNSTFYTADGTLTGDRIVTGGSNDLTFTDIIRSTMSASDVHITASDTIDINGNDIDIDATGAMTIDVTGAMSTTVSGNATTTVTGTTTLTNTGDVFIGVGGQDSTIHIGTDGTLLIEDYGAGDNLGNATYLLGVEADGSIVDVDISTIGNNAVLSDSVDLNDDGIFEHTLDEAIQAENLDPDSTIYNYDGTLQGTRTMTMNGNNLYFIGTDTVTITNDGKLAIGRGSVNSDVELHVDGDILAVRVHSSSDARFKKDVSAIESAIDKVMKIDGVTYFFRNEEFKNRNFPDSRQIGFIAQNVNKVLPAVVMTENDGYMAIDYGKLTALLNEAIKEQQQQILTLKNELVKTQGQNSSLAQEIAEIKILIKGLIKDDLSEED